MLVFSKIRWIHGSIGAVLFISAFGCSDSTNMLCSTVAPAEAVTDPRMRTIDDDLAELADRVPGFGGYFIDPNPRDSSSAMEPKRQLTIWLVNPDPSLIASAREELATLFPQANLENSSTVSLEATFDYRQLKTWYDTARNILSIPGVVYTGISEATNRLEYGVENEASGDCVTTNLQNLGVPHSAFEIVTTSVVEPD